MHYKSSMSKSNTSADFVRREARKQFERPDDFVWVKDVLSDCVIVDAEQSGETYKAAYTAEAGKVTFGDLEPVDAQFISKARAKGCELTGPIAWKNEAKRLAFGAVLVPGEPDSDGDVLTAEKIADVAHDWLAEYGNIDLQHSLNNAALPVESYILPMDMPVKLAGRDAMLPAGTWILGSRIDDDELWGKVVKGELTGYSIMGVRRAAMKSQDAALKRTMLADLGPDWVAPFVSLVDAPAVPKAKFFALKSVTDDVTDAEPEEKKPGFIGRLLQTMKSEENTMSPDEIKEAIKAAVKEELAAIEQPAEQIEEIATEQAQDQTVDNVEELVETAEVVEEIAEKAESNDGEIESLKSKIAELETKLQSGSRALKSEEGQQPAAPSVPSDRDAFGRKIRK